MKRHEQVERELLEFFDKEIAEAGLNELMSSGGYCESARAAQRKATATKLRKQVVAALTALRAAPVSFDEQAIRTSERTRCIVICNKVQDDDRDLDNVLSPGAIECAARIRDLGSTLSTHDMLMTLAQRVADAQRADDDVAIDIEPYVEEVMSEVFLRETVERTQ